MTDGYYETRCLLKATIDVAGGLDVVVSHFGLNPDEQYNALTTVMSHIRNERFVLMGDFNVQSDSPALAPIQAALKDTAEAFSAPRLSFPSDKPEVKIDYVFVSHDISVVSADIPPLILSDHRPHLCVIDI